MATENQLEEIRRSIGDTLKYHAQQFNGDNQTILFKLKYKNIENVDVKVDGENVAFAIKQEAGAIQLEEAPSEDAVIIVDFNFCAFTTDYLDRVCNEHGVEGTIIICLRELLASASRRSDYTQGQTKVSASQVFDQLEKLLAKYTNGGALSTATNNGLTIGSRQPDTKAQKMPRIDLSRDDSFGEVDPNWSSNNVG